MNGVKCVNVKGPCSPGSPCSSGAPAEIATLLVRGLHDPQHKDARRMRRRLAVALRRRRDADNRRSLNKATRENVVIFSLMDFVTLMLVVSFSVASCEGELARGGEQGARGYRDSGRAGGGGAGCRGWGERSPRRRQCWGRQGAVVWRSGARDKQHRTRGAGHQGAGLGSGTLWVGYTMGGGCHGGVRHGWGMLWVGYAVGGESRGWGTPWVGYAVGGVRRGWSTPWVGYAVGGVRRGWGTPWVGYAMGGGCRGWGTPWAEDALT